MHFVGIFGNGGLFGWFGVRRLGVHALISVLPRRLYEAEFRVDDVGGKVSSGM